MRQSKSANEGRDQDFGPFCESGPGPRLVDVRHDPGQRVTTYTYSFRGDGEEPPVEVRHDRRRHRYRIRVPDGQAAEFDDRPARFLLMKRDEKTRKLQPVLVGGKPQYHYLAPEVSRAITTKGAKSAK
jgi:hypothetical protein